MDRRLPTRDNHLVYPMLELPHGEDDIFEVDVLEGIPVEDEVAVMAEGTPEVAPCKEDDR